jgi:hypothetical protein
VSTRKVVLLGMMTKMPVAGVVWQTVHYLIGLARLGYEPYYVESHARTPSMFMDHERDDGSAKAAAFISKTMRRFGLADRWAFLALHDDRRCYGLSPRELAQLYGSAEVLINLHGGTEPLPEHYATGRLVYVETDPVQLHVELHDGVEASVEFLEPHCAFFTFAENLGAPDCVLPCSSRFRFHPTRQPVVVDLWQERAAEATAEAFTTVANWRQKWRSVRLDGDMYTWTKDSEFERFLDLPARTGATFELALASYRGDDRRKLERHGWRVRDAAEVSADADAYRDYVGGSRAEFTAAKDQNVRLRTGWFSDRSATYLAAGRPVVTQDTGFGNVLPTGEGLFAVQGIDDAAAAVDQILANSAYHSKSALAVAREWFDAKRVLAELLVRVGVERSNGGRRRAPRDHGSPEADAGTSEVAK